MAVIAVAGVMAGALGLLTVAGFVLGLGIWYFICPIAGIAGLIGAQFILAKAMGMPVRGPAETMGSPPDVEADPAPGPHVGA